MRVSSTLALVGVACVLIGADAAPRFAAINRPTVEVRGNKSTIYSPCGQLRQNQPVQILRDEDGWLAITPPVGSSSWIMDRVVNFDTPPTNGRPAIGLVVTDDAPVLLGTPDKNTPHPVETCRVKRGTLVVAFGEKSTSEVIGESTTWWRIQPCPGEARYIPRDSVGAMTQITAAMTTASPKQFTDGKPKPQAFVQAEQAEAQGDLVKADLLFRQLAADQSQPGGDHDLAMRCQTRIDILAKRQIGRVNGTAPGQLVSNPGSTGTQVFTSGPGYLRRTAFQIDGRAAYVLEDYNGQPRVYLMPQAGLTIESFVNRRIEALGPMVSRSDLTIGQYIQVERLHVLR